MGVSLDINILINQLIKLFITLCVGYLMYKFNIIDKHFNQRCSKFILTIALPLMIISSVLSLTNRPKLSSVIAVFVVSIIMYTIIPVVGYVITLITKVPHKSRGVYTFMYTFSNVGFMGFPILNALFGPTAVFYAGIVNIIFNLACYSYGPVLINLGTDDKSDFSFKKLISPGMICSVFALILYIFDIHFPSLIEESIDSIGDLTPTLSMIIIGSTLATINVKEVFNDFKVYIFAVIKQIVIPILAMPLCRLLLNGKLLLSDELVYMVTMIMLCMPVANSAVLFTTNYGHDEDLAAKTVFITTLLSMFSIPLIMMFA